VNGANWRYQTALSALIDSGHISSLFHDPSQLPTKVLAQKLVRRENKSGANAYGEMITKDRPKLTGPMIQSKQWVSEQSAVIEELESGGADTLDAILYLETLEKMHSQNIEYLMRLERKVLLLVRPED
jgi:hypothetical protein